MAKLYILCGYPFAGKSTIARSLIKKFGLVRVALDDINSERGIGKDSHREITSDEWQGTYDIYHNRIVHNLQEGNSVVTDTVGHTKKARNELRKLAKNNNAEAIILYVATPFDIVKERWLNNRQTKNRPDVRDNDFNRVVNDFEIPNTDEDVVTITPDMEIEEIYKLIEK